MRRHGKKKEANKKQNRSKKISTKHHNGCCIHCVSEHRSTKTARTFPLQSWERREFLTSQKWVIKRERERESHTHNRRSIQTPLKCEPNCSLIGSKKRAQPQIRASNHATTCRFDAPPRLQSKNVMDIGNPKAQTRKE